MAKITPALPNGPTVASVFGEDWIQNDLANLTVDYKASLAENVRLGSCVYFNSLNKKWSILNGMNPPKNAMLGIVIHFDFEGKGQVKIHGIFESPLLEENKPYYVDSLGNLTTTVTQVPFGQTTGRGILILKINGGDPSGGGSGGGESQVVEELEDYSPVSTQYPYQAVIRGKPSATTQNPMVVRFFAMVLDTSINAITTTINMNFDEACPFVIGEVVQIDEEKLRIINISGNVVVVERGVEGTLSAVHNAQSNTSPILAFGKELEENPSSPVSGQYQITHGALQFSILDKGKFVFSKYDSIGRNLYIGNDPLRNYGLNPEKGIVAILSGTIPMPVYLECQLFYVRKGAKARAQYPGLLVRATNGIVNSGDISAEGLIPAGWWGRGGGAGGHAGNGHAASHSGYYACQVLVYNGQTPNLEQQNSIIEAHKTFPIFNGGGGTSSSGGGGAGGGGVTLISPYLYHVGKIYTYGHGGGGGNSATEGFAGGGGAGGGILLVGETVIHTGTYSFGGAGGGWWSWKSGGNGGQAGGAGWVRVIEYGGRN